MARWRVTISGKGIRKASVEKFAKGMSVEFGTEASISVEDDSFPESRADRLSKSLSMAADISSEVGELRDELQEWHDNLPDSFRDGDKGDELQQAIDELESIADEAQTLSERDDDVSFPSMY